MDGPRRQGWEGNRGQVRARSDALTPQMTTRVFCAWTGRWLRKLGRRTKSLTSLVSTRTLRGSSTRASICKGACVNLLRRCVLPATTHYFLTMPHRRLGTPTESPKSDRRLSQPQERVDRCVEVGAALGESGLCVPRLAYSPRGVEYTRMSVIGEILTKCLAIGIAGAGAFLVATYAINNNWL
jgi:hypothetical protein